MNRFPGIDSASLCSRADQYVKKGCRTGLPGWESIPALPIRFTNSGSVFTASCQLFFADRIDQKNSGRCRKDSALYECNIY
jgi:hypothetical protein